MIDKLYSLKKYLEKENLYSEASSVNEMSYNYSLQPEVKEEEEKEEVLEPLPFKDPEESSQQELHKKLDELFNPIPNKTYDPLFDMPDDGDEVEFETLVELGILTQKEVDEIIQADSINSQLIEERINKYKNSLRLERRYYIRFGNIVSLSQNKLSDQEAVAEMKGVSQEEYQFHKELQTGKQVFYEPGMSAYYARQYGNKWMIAIDPYNLGDMLDIMEQRIKDGAIYLITAVQRSLGVGDNPTYGSDAEPLVEDVRVIKRLSLDEVVLPISRPGEERDEHDRIIRKGNTFYEYGSDTPPELPNEEEFDKMTLDERREVTSKWFRAMRNFKKPSYTTKLKSPTLREWLHYHFKEEVKRVYGLDLESPIDFWYDKLNEQYADWIIEDIYESGNLEENFEFSSKDESIIKNFVKNNLSNINIIKGKNAWSEVANKIENIILDEKDLESSLDEWYQSIRGTVYRNM